MEDVGSLVVQHETIDVAVNPLVMLWMKEKAKRDPIAFCRLAENNGQRFSKLFGHGVKVEDLGGALVWGIEDLGIPMFLVCSAGGSQYKIHYPGGDRAFASDRKMGSAVTAFLERLLLELSGYGSGNRAKLGVA